MEFAILLCGGVVILLYFLYTLKYNYWKKRGVPFLTPLPILGNYKDFFLLQANIGETVEKIYIKFPKEPVVGAYFGTEPVLIIKDPEVIKTVFAKDFSHFSGRELVDHEFREPLIQNNVFSTSGDNWKVLRQSVNPMFSSAKLKKMFYLVTECGKSFESYLDNQYKGSPEQNMKVIATNFTMEVIGSCVFGLKFGTLSDEKNRFRDMGKNISNVTISNALKNSFRQVWPSIYYFFFSKGDILPDGVNSFFYNLSKKNIESRGGKPIGRNDLVDFLLKYRQIGYIEGDGVFDNVKGEAKRLRIDVTDDMMAAQSLVFFAAGHETSALTLSFTFYELSRHPDIQERLFKEIEEVLSKHNNEITYESLQDMKYMDMVLTETLRKYPVLYVITRECMKDYTFVDQKLKVEKGMRIHVPVWSIHHDPKYYPDPETFDPERFSQEQLEKRHQYTFLAFGEGQRICIGQRFSKLSLGVGLVTVLRKFRLERSERAVEKMAFDPKSIIIAPTTGSWVTMVPRK